MPGSPVRPLKRTLGVLALAAAAVALTACSTTGPAPVPTGSDSAAPGATAAPTPVTIRVATTAATVPFQAAIIAGIYKDAGITVEATTLASGTDTIAALVGGSVDIAYADTYAGVGAISNGFDIGLVAGNNRITPEMQYQVPGDSAIKTPADLEGKKLGVVTAPYATVLAKAWLEHYGADPSKVTLVTIRSGLGEALQSGGVDAIQVTGTPGAFYKYAKDFGYRELGDPDTSKFVAPEGLQAGFWSSTSWATSNPDIAQRFAEAVWAANSWWASISPTERAVFYKQVTDVDIVALDAQYPGALDDETDAANLVTGPIDVAATVEWIKAGNQYAPDRVPSGVDFPSHVFPSAG